MKSEVKHQQQEHRINESGCDISFLWIFFYFSFAVDLVSVQKKYCVGEIRIKARAFSFSFVGMMLENNEQTFMKQNTRIKVNQLTKSADENNIENCLNK